MTKNAIEDRIEHAEQAIFAYAQERAPGEVQEQSILFANLLIDLMHYAKRERIDFRGQLNEAAAIFDKEGG